MDRTTVNVLGVLFVVLVVIFSFCGGAFADRNTAINALENQGFTDVQITGHIFLGVGLFGCGQDDNAKFDATAVNPTGQKVKVYVCVGWPLKGGTVRSF